MKKSSYRSVRRFLVNIIRYNYFRRKSSSSFFSSDDQQQQQDVEDVEELVEVGAEETRIKSLGITRFLLDQPVSSCVYIYNLYITIINTTLR